MSAVPKRNRAVGRSEPDCSETRPPSASSMPSPMGNSMAAVVVLEMNALMVAAITPKATTMR